MPRSGIGLNELLGPHSTAHDVLVDRQLVDIEALWSTLCQRKERFSYTVNKLAEKCLQFFHFGRLETQRLLEQKDGKRERRIIKRLQCGNLKVHMFFVRVGDDLTAQTK